MDTNNPLLGALQGLNISSQNNNPLISIILRSYNRPKYLARAIESIANQSYPNWELIIADDHSTDINVQRLLVYLQDTDRRINFIYQPKNFGFVCRGTNDALDIARGDYVSFLDDDNFYMKNRLELLVAKALEGNYDLTYSLSYIGSLEGNNHGIHRFGKGDKFDYEQMKRQNFLDSMEYIIKKSVVDDIGYFDETLSTSEDWHFLLRVCNKYKNIGFVDLPLSYYSQHPDRRMFKTINIDIPNVAKIRRDLEKLNRPKKILIIKSHDKHNVTTEMISLMVSKMEQVETKIINDNCDRDRELAIFNPDIVIGIMPFIADIPFPNKINKDCQWVIIDPPYNEWVLELSLWDWIVTDKNKAPEGKKMIYYEGNLDEKKIKKIFQLIEANRANVTI